jgi:uncharacterized protein (DUF2147 family)
MRNSTRRLLSALVASIACLLSFGACAQGTTAVGLWQTYSDITGEADGIVRIVEVQGMFEGRLEAVLSPPAPTPRPICDKCPGDLRGKPVVGLKILYGLRREGDAYTGGEILDPHDGRVYRCNMRLLEGGRKLELRGYIGIPAIGRTLSWMRIE